ncbi:hypothetical protein IJT17_04425 [bacterium]|nr:hypothetical protein [bacterium]
MADKSRASRPSNRPATKTKVLMLGCSYTYGIGVEDKDTYVWLLNERFPNVTFDNYASDGYGTLQCLLREEKILKEHHYDYVIYAAIWDHMRRNISYATWQIDSAKTKTAQRDTLIGMLKSTRPENPMWYYPLASVNSDGSLGIRRAAYHWPGDEHSAIINTLKRLCMFRYCYKVTHNMQEYGPYSQEVYWHILYRMNQIAQERGSKFAVICLTNSDNVPMLPPTEKQIEAWNKNHSQKLSLPLPFPYVFVTDGHEGEPDQPKFHVAGNMFWHGTPIVHRNWEKHISAWLTKWFQETDTTNTNP